MSFPSAGDLVKEATENKPKDLNELHSNIYNLMMKYKSKYYKEKVDSFLSKTSIKEPQLSELRKKMLKPVQVDNITYNNFMEEASRRISQTFQVVSGNIAELCVESALNDVGLVNKVHYLRRKNRADFTFYYPDIKTQKRVHRLEVKNVKLRERGARGLVFDADSIIGFFDSPKEFTKDNIRVIEEHCANTGGYCYVPKNIKCSFRPYKTF